MMGAASRLSSQVLWTAIVLRPPMKISLIYSSMARLESRTYGTYLASRNYHQPQSRFEWQTHRTTRIGQQCRQGRHVEGATQMRLVHDKLLHDKLLKLGPYLMTTTWSGCSPGLYSRGLEATMSSTTLLLLISYSRPGR